MCSLRCHINGIILVPSFLILIRQRYLSGAYWYHHGTLLLTWPCLRSPLRYFYFLLPTLVLCTFDVGYCVLPSSPISPFQFDSSQDSIISHALTMPVNISIPLHPLTLFSWYIYPPVCSPSPLPPFFYAYYLSYFDVFDENHVSSTQIRCLS